MSTGLQEREILLKSTDARPDRIASSNPSDFAIPNGREEEWRYTPLKRLGKLHEEVTADQEINYEVVAPAGITYTVVDRKDVVTKFLATDRVSSRTESLSLVTEGRPPATE